MAENTDKAGVWLLGGLIGGAVLMVALHGLPTIPQPACDGTGTDCADLAAQQSMAFAAWAMFATAAVSLVIGFITLRLLRQNLEEARKVTKAALESAQAARETVEVTENAAHEAREMGMAQVRAYLAVRDVAILLGNVMQEISLQVTNAGQSPARNLTVEMELTISTNDNFPFIDDDWLVLHKASVPPSIRPDLPSGATDNVVRKALATTVDTGDLDSYVQVRIVGKVAFADVFGYRLTETFAFEAVRQREDIGQQIKLQRTATA